jgi:hypothetical protein
MPALGTYSTRAQFCMQDEEQTIFGHYHIVDYRRLLLTL